MSYNRRDFISFLGKSSMGVLLTPPFLAACGNNPKPIRIGPLSDSEITRMSEVLLQPLAASSKDELLLTEGLSADVLIKWGESITDKEYFGTNNDFTCFIPLDDNNPDDGLLWVNHESVNALFISNFDFYRVDNPMQYRTIEQVDKEMYNVGGSIVRIKKTNGQWRVVKNDPFNRRITAKTPIKLNWDKPIKGKSTVIGTHSNCSGGITPWKTILTCEENYDNFYGETRYDANNIASHEPSIYGWENFYNYPTEHYGWVVEVDPRTGEVQKHIALGRFAHECCTVYELSDKRVVAYSGDDRNDEHLYKFISSKPGSLKKGTLYVADTENGKWLSLDWKSQPVLQNRFKDQTEVLIRVREAAKLVGATPLNRPEDIEIDPITGHVLVTLTNNKTKGDFHGSILKIQESEDQFDSLSFQASTYLAGGEENGFSCPDNLAFDLAGNLWMTSDMSDGSMNRADKPYANFKNNSLFVIPRHGKDAGKVVRVASAPRDAEFTGPWFAPDGKTLFLSVQHPGNQTRDLENPTSQWPFDGDNLPKSAVVAISGDLLEKLNALNQFSE